MKIVILDGYALNPGDLSWGWLETFGSVAYYDRHTTTQETIARCRHTVMIPMYHGVDSLNVAAASAVAFWQLRKR